MLEDWLEKLVQVGELYDDSDLTETDIVMETTQTLDSAAAAMQGGRSHGEDSDSDRYFDHWEDPNLYSSTMHPCHGTTHPDSATGTDR